MLPDKGWHGWMASPIGWIWVWVSSGSWWWTRKPGVLQSMGSQRVGHDWVTEPNWTDATWAKCSHFLICPQGGADGWDYNKPFKKLVTEKIVIDSELAQSCPTLCDPMDSSQPGFSVHGIFPDKNTGVGCHFLLQGIFQTQGSNLGLPIL